MSQSSNISLVRCPNCDHLLPETDDYSVFLCGGCHTVLRGKRDFEAENCENDDVKETPTLNIVSNTSETEPGKAEIGRESMKSARRDEASELLRKLDELLIMNDDTRDGFQYQDYPFYNGCVRRRRQQGSQNPTHFPNHHFQPYRPCFNLGRYRNLSNHNHLSEPCGFLHWTHKKTVPTTAPPLHGGAPFVTCSNCLELLQVPNFVLLTDNTRRKIKCWACSTTLHLTMVGKNLRVSVMEEMIYPPRRNRASMNFSSQDYDNSGHNFHSMDWNWDWEVNKSAELRSVESGAAFSSEEEEIGPRKIEPINCLDEKNTTHKLKQSSLAGMIKKRLKEKFSRTIDQSSINVTVNGQPIPDRLLKKAEKLAGPIQPGNYWYDIKAGFWGWMNGPCLGIIPPLIEELNNPIEKKCSGGNSGVFVNGRELHQKDLQILSMRGLPMVRGRSYTIEISGRIWDDESGMELDSLGKLAPTVEMAKHGFGMRPPKLSF